jgi:CrcB protein
MLVALLVVGGVLGAPARYLVDGLVQRRAGGVVPWGTMVVNLSGSLVLGFVTGLTLYHGLGPLPRAALGTGFCGAYTTFSTFSYETVRLLEDGALPAAALNVAASVVFGLAAAGVGLALAAAW